MFEPWHMALLVAGLLAMVFAGVGVAVSLGTTAILGFFLVKPSLAAVADFAAVAAYEVVREYSVAVIPLFMLMGEFLARCGAARDVFTLVDRVLPWLPGRLAIATVVANAVFAFVTGVSLAAAAAFSRIAGPEMDRAGYDRRFALGCIAGSASLGMLIPPSVLMIVWAVLTDLSIGDLFIGALVPGLMVAGSFVLYILAVALLAPDRVGEGRRPHPVGAEAFPRRPAARRSTPPRRPRAQPGDGSLAGGLVMPGLVFTLLLGIWHGIFTPTEGAGVGAAVALLLAVYRGLRWREVIDVILTVGRTSAPLLLLLVFAQLYARALSMTGVTGLVQAMLIGSGLEPWQVIALMVVIWMALGCLIDTLSILILTVPIFSPVATALGFDPVAFAILGILAVETGMLTPPFGMLVFTVKAAMPDADVTTAEIFRGAAPYWLCLLVTVAIVAAFPQTVTAMVALVHR